ncbi:hypothetical protein CR513_21540, partial [Mucuna pruriens]
MKLATEFEAQVLTAKITSQVNGDYLANDPQLIMYWDKIHINTCPKGVERVSRLALQTNKHSEKQA